MRIALVIPALVLALAVAALANDRYIVGAGGTWKPMQGEHPSVRMLSERVRVDVYRDRYDVRATFLFLNDGPAVKVVMGFPEHGLSADLVAADYAKRSGFLRFATSVDGRQVAARRVFEPMDPPVPFYQAHWLKEVTFAAGQRRTVEVRYTAPVGRAMGGAFVSYDFTGGNWKGTVERSVLELVSHVPGDRLDSASTKATRHPEKTVWIFERSDWEAEEAVELYFERKR